MTIVFPEALDDHEAPDEDRLRSTLCAAMASANSRLAPLGAALTKAAPARYPPPLALCLRRPESDGHYGPAQST